MSLKRLKLALAGTVIGVAAHQQARAQTPCTKFRASVTASISSIGGVAGVASVKPDQACIAVGGAIYWKVSGGDSWATDFIDDAHSPFDPGKTHHEGKTGYSGGGDHVRACSKTDASFNAAVGGCVFKYKATHVKGAKTSVIDPQVVVQPGT